MAFHPGYVITGTSKRDRVKQLGKGVTPPAAEWLFRVVTTALGNTTTDTVKEAA
jgi:DNA (cytosine-5)-methyltransferase 1